MEILFIAARVICFTLLLCAGSLSADNTASPMGTNFWFFNDYQYTWPFVDFFKTSRPFWSSSSSAWDDGRSLTLDTNGYPMSLLSGQYAATVLFFGGGEPHPAGDYTLLYDGQGQVQIDQSQGAAITVVSNAAGRIVFTVPGANQGFRIRIMQTTAGNYVRNIRVIAPGFEQTYATQIFHPLFLERLGEMRCLRFMDWMEANTTTIKNWSERTKTTYQTQVGPSGVALEYLVELCNRLRCDGWFCLPVRGTNDCFKQYAAYIRDHLDPCLKAYFEFGNECWNGGVQSNVGYMDSIGVILGFTSGWDAQHHGWARRMTDMLCIIDTVYAGHMDRCVRILATQVGNTGVVDGLLNFYGGVNHGDAIAVAPYFNGRSLHGGTDINQWLDSLAADASTTDKKISADHAIAVAHNMKLVAYESGLDVWPASYGITDSLARQIRFAPRMQTIYTDMLNKWRSGGGTLINQYTFCDPSWGLLEYQDQDTNQAPAYLAATNFIRSNPRWWTETREICSTGVRNETPPRPYGTIMNSDIPLRIEVSRGGVPRIHTGLRESQVRMYSIDGKEVALKKYSDEIKNFFVPIKKLKIGCYVVQVLGDSGGMTRMYTQM
jgi:hypothetical protein